MHNKHDKKNNKRDRGIERVLQRGNEKRKGHQGKMEWTSKGDWGHKMNPAQSGY